MSWFDEQIKNRIKADNEAFENAFAGMADIITGKNILYALENNRENTKDAIGQILKFHHAKPTELPDEIKDVNDQIEYLCRPAGVMRRTVNLEGSWYSEAVGAFLATLKSDGSVVALLPCGFSSYSFTDKKCDKKIKINKKTAQLLETEAICFYTPLPLKKLSIKDLLLYITQTLRATDLALVLFATLVVTLLGMLSPKINKIIFGYVVTSSDISLLIGVTILIACVSFSVILIYTVKTMLMERIQTKMHTSVQAAAMMRVLTLPADFFKKYSSGELSSRLQSINNLSSMLVSAILTTGLTSLFSLLYITQIWSYAPGLFAPALVIIFATIFLSLVSTFVQMNISRRSMKIGAKEAGMNFALVSGVQKIKLSGAEKRAFSKWANIYNQKAKLTYSPPLFIKMNPVISIGISLAGTIIIYYFAVVSKVSVADYYAFNFAYGMVSGSFMSLSGMAITLAEIKPIFEMVQPILETVPEVSMGKKVVTRISGSIELNNISFRYNENMPLVLDNLTLKIKAGQYVAIVGKTGCGKSTLLRMLLGFEKPIKGATYYDGQDIANIDLKSLRRKIGVVMQNGKLFPGDVFSNITVSAPWLTLEEAWSAAELAGIATDIRDMPMGMHTMISEGSGGVSGGQRQRLMIARAIAPKPKILMFDEATSALDNITQKTVSNSLEALKCTRIVIAHRLSTIKQCDRIIVLESGKIIEDGGYEELIAKEGYFAELVARQRFDDTEFVEKTTVF